MSQNRSIREHHYQIPPEDFLKLLHHSYAKAPHFRKVMEVVHSVFELGNGNVAETNAQSVVQVFRYLGLPRYTVDASIWRPQTGLRGSERLIDLCRFGGATTYLNAPGGRALYAAENFESEGIHLRFLDPDPAVLSSPRTPQGPPLSILDALMWHPIDEVVKSLSNHAITSG